ncbi:glycosyltransferase [Desemzia incerta]|uniref:glycosyltransferase n=1 Tax=Desemzia incerta TaxID=82801 RepID=UPI0024C21843|nr:glycosyltransferase [Desemzia incerta]WHZ31950.1 glycosyltransferase [Desemzia incerta]
MSNSKFSVLLSVYQKEKEEYLSNSLQSIINQTVVPDEIILVEDGPLNRNLDDVINRFVAEYPGLFKIVKLEKNVGLGLALNEGLKNSSHELVARMDTDDIAKPNRFEKQLQAFETNPQFSIVGSNIDEFVSDPSNVVSRRVVPEKNSAILKFSKRRNPFNHPSVMYKKSDVLSSGGYRDFRRNQDYDLFVRMLNNGYIGFNIQQSLLFFRADAGNLNRRKSWTKTKSDIYLRYTFYKKGYSSLNDFLITTGGFLLVFVTPISFFNFINKKLLRK